MLAYDSMTSGQKEHLLTRYFQPEIRPQEVPGDLCSFHVFRSRANCENYYDDRVTIHEYHGDQIEKPTFVDVCECGQVMEFDGEEFFCVACEGEDDVITALEKRRERESNH